MEKRVVVFLILSLLIIMGWNIFLEQMGWIPEQTSPELSTTETPISQDPIVAEGPPEPTHDSASAELDANAISSETSVPDDHPTSQMNEEQIVIETDLYRAELSNRGGVITRWELKRYTNPGPDGPVPIQLVYQEGQFKKPLSLSLPDEGLTKEISQSVFAVHRDFTVLDRAHPVGHLTFSYSDADRGIKIDKTLTFHSDSYIVDISVTTAGLSSGFDIGLGTNFGIVEWGEGFIGLVGPAYSVDEELEKETPETTIEKRGNIRWVALQDKYFISVFLHEDADSILLTKEGEKLVSAKSRFAGSSKAALQLFAGPKQYDQLASLKVGLEDTIDFGWFIYGSWSIVRAVAEPLFSILRFIYGYTQNYGIAIIFVTLFIKLLFVPLQYKSYKSMKDMQVIQPKVLEIQKKFKDDRERLNKELIKLYRDHKVNPVGGCLPMLLQMPVFIALFNILYMTIDLRQAPFGLWIQDLSAPDPFFVLPILMGLSMVLQQKIMPTTMDPTQAKMMLILPVFLTFVFLNFASGLVLYWLTNNVLTIAQQVVTDRYIFKKPTFSSSSSSSEGNPQHGNDSAKPSKKNKEAGKN